MAADKAIRLKPAESLLKRRVGDEIALNERDSRLLSEGSLAEIGTKYG